jgi:hypothetical protein
MDNQILSNALLGTARQPYRPAGGGEGLGDLLRNLPGDNSEKALLGAAAASFLFERAGVKLAVDTQPLPDPAPAETLRPCSVRSRLHLNRILSSRQYDVLREWLGALAQAGKRLPTEKLPEMLALMEAQAYLAPQVEPVLGERGRWLAAQNPAWTLFAKTNLAEAGEIWETGSRTNRVAFLKKLRAFNPEQARSLLAETWGSENAEQRAAFLGTFEQNLSMADEPFLEQRLDDRSKEVRSVAADLLVHLPESALVGRMVARANAIIEYVQPKKGFLGLKANKAPFQVKPFDTADPSMLRDGIEPKSSSRTMGDKSYILSQIVGAIPPAYWPDHWQANPHALLRDAAESEYAEVLVRGWRDALRRYPNSTWADVFMQYWLSRQEKRLKDYYQPVFSGLSYAQFEELVFESFRKDTEALWDKHPATELIIGYEGGNWRPELVLALVKSLKKRINSTNAYQWRLQKDGLKKLALHIPPGMASELAEGWPEDSQNWSGWAKDVREFLSLLELRKEMLKEIFA